MSKRVLLTGGNGFIGRWVLAELLRLGYEVHHIGRNESVLSNSNDNSNLFYHQCNILSVNDVNKTVNKIKPTHLLHLAWDVTHGEFWTSEANLTWVNASIELLKIFQKQGGERVVMAGTCAEYDWEYGCCVENVTPIVPKTLYGVCKASLSSIMQSFCKQKGISAAWGRIFYLYGPYENSARFVPSIINSMLTSNVVKCSHGKQLRDFMYVADVANAFVSLLDSSVEGSVNISSGTPVRLKNIVETAANITEFQGAVEYGALPSPQSEPDILLSNNQRLLEEVHFVPAYNLRQGMSEMVKWFKTTNDL